MLVKPMKWWMSYNLSKLVVDDFYDNPDEVRDGALKNEWQKAHRSVEKWYSTQLSYKPDEVIKKFSDILNLDIDRNHWETGTNWNGKFQVKLAGCGIGYHDHVYDYGFNPVGKDGWGCIIFLSPNISYDQGLLTAKPKDTDHSCPRTYAAVCTCDVKNPKMRNENDIFLHDSPGFCKGRNCDINHDYYKHDTYISNVYNRAVFFRGDVWHSGTTGIGDSIKTGRMIQTFFIRGKSERNT